MESYSSVWDCLISIMTMYSSLYLPVNARQPELLGRKRLPILDSAITQPIMSALLTPLKLFRVRNKR